MASSPEHNNETRDALKEGEFIDQPNVCQLLEKNPSVWS
jgi:hypothetical protein